MIGSWNWCKVRSLFALLAMLILACCVAGCRPQHNPPEEPPPGGPVGTGSEPASATAPETHPGEQTPPADQAPPESSPQEVSADTSPPAEPSKPVIPQVRLSESMQASCVVGVGDVMPGGRLPDATGQPRLIRDLLGEQLTVMCFFSAGDSPLSALAAGRLLADLQKHVAAPFTNRGVQVVAIAAGGPPDQLGPIVEKVNPSFPVLIDQQKAYLALVAKEILPRVYLLDRSGKVLWFDLAFTELAGPVRKNLLQAIAAALAEQPPAGAPKNGSQ